MPVINFKGVNEIYYNNNDIKEVWYGGERLWKRKRKTQTTYQNNIGDWYINKSDLNKKSPDDFFVKFRDRNGLSSTVDLTTIFAFEVRGKRYDVTFFEQVGDVYQYRYPTSETSLWIYPSSGETITVHYEG